MKRVEIIGMSIFGALALGGIGFSIWNSGRTRERMARYAVRRGGTMWGDNAKRMALVARLNDMTPGWSWTADPVMQVHPPPESVYLFGYQHSRRSRSSGTSFGFACFAERTSARPAEHCIEITRRIPYLDKMVDDRVETGSEEFRREFTVACRDASIAGAAVTPEVQRILLDHAAGPGWNVVVVIGPRGVVARSSHANGEPEWDYITAMALRLRDALR
jgi:hypothetical protein